MNEITITIDNKIYRLTNINNGSKYDRAQIDAGPNGTIKQVLAHYDKLAGYIQDEDGHKINNGQFWEEEKIITKNDFNNLTNKSDSDLEEIIRRAENTNISGSLFQRAKIELELRDRKKLNIIKLDKWWEKTWIQIIMLVGAIAGIIGLLTIF